MALVIGVKEGSAIYVGNDLVRVVETTRDKIVVECRGRRYVLTEDEAEEILPGVFAYKGIGGYGKIGLQRLMFEAPRSIKIRRVRNG